MASDFDIRRLTSPKIFLIGMTSFLVIVGFVAMALYKALAFAFNANPGLNSLIFGVLALGSVFAFRQVFRLFREIDWVNSLVSADPGRVRAPLLLAPMATMLNAGAGARGLSTITTRAILDSVGTRLDEGRELNRYLVGLLVFLGLLGTFWGLLQTVHSIGAVIDSMRGGANNAAMFEDLKSGLSAPLAGMSVSFTSSLFGLAGSLILGFLDLQAGQAQNRFYTELEDFLAGHVDTTQAGAPEDAPRRGEGGDSKRSAAALAQLAEGVQGLVGHMRDEQQQIRDWVERQAAVQEDIRRLLRRLSDQREKQI
ncbi:MAG: flagellar motor protein MotA [Pseudomonadota bacterium]|nr:flagellar motor protein MotA [Pseudomonadota bacterium]